MAAKLTSYTASLLQNLKIDFRSAACGLMKMAWQCIPYRASFVSTCERNHLVCLLIFYVLISAYI